MVGLQWSLNSSAPMPLAAISAALGKELAHWERVLDLRLLRAKLAQQEALAANKSPEPEQDSPTQRTASHASAVRQMRAGIQAAAAVAESMERGELARFSVTICGHVDLDYSDGVEERMQVFVDAATPPRDGWPKEPGT